ncbi:MAG: M23 family metallopeptidase [Rubricoccaceae bacterium]|nr:M23 family metallopeptidase [Rubricoccaceae bacterium]
MRNKYFYYDHEACTFVEVQPSKTRWLVQGAIVASLVVVFTIAGLWIFSRNMTTPNEIAQRQEIEELRGHLASANDRMTAFSDKLEDLAETDRELYRTVLGTEPISEDEFQVGVGGSRSDMYSRFSGPTANLLRETSATFDRLERQFSLQTRSFEELTEIAESRQAELNQQPAILPLRNARLTSGFGRRFHPILRMVRMHSGVDFPTPTGTAVYATGAGVVSFVGSRRGYGNVVEISHPLAGRKTRYAHLARAAAGINVGTQVTRGQMIAYSGNTGLSTAPHLHYEVRRLSDDEALNPVATFVPGVSASEYQELLTAASMDTASFD